MPQMSAPGSPSTIHRDSARPTPPPWLNPAITPQATQKFFKPRIGPTSGLPSGAKVNGPFTTFLMPAAPSAGKCANPTSRLGAMRSRSFGSRSCPKSQGVVSCRPGHSGALVGAHEHAAALLADVDFAFEVDGVQLFLLAGQFRHVAGDQVLMLHRQDGQLDADHAAHLARPQAPGIHHMLGMHIAVIGDHIPGAVGARL